jgi:S-adenosylmethionine hydrolase
MTFVSLTRIFVSLIREADEEWALRGQNAAPASLTSCLLCGKMVVGERMSQPIITLTTDFGQTDSYVGAMKGAILSICPRAALVDISHEIRPQSVQQAAYVLSTATPYFPAGAVHLVVVDPGVGTGRRPVVVQTERALYVAPDNGVLELVLNQEPAQRAVHLTEPRYRLPQVSATFHGRDIFAPAAAYLACGTTPDQMGESISPTELVPLELPEPQAEPGGQWKGMILHIDHFGNLITNIRIANAESPISIVAGGRRIEALSYTFGDVDAGELMAYVGSSGHLEIAIRDGNAARALDMDIGDAVEAACARL